MFHRTLLIVGLHLLFAGALLSAAAEPDSPRQAARDEIVRNFGEVREMATSGGVQAFAVDLPPEVDAELVERFSPLAELSLAGDNAAAVLERVVGSKSLVALALEEPDEKVFKLAARIGPLKRLWLSAYDDQVLTGEMLDQLLPAVNLKELGIDGYQVTGSGAETLGRFTGLEALSLVGGIESSGLKMLSGLKQLKALDIDDFLDETLDLSPLAALDSLETLSLELPEDQALVADDFALLAALPKLRQLDLGACEWDEDDIARLKASRSLRVVISTREIDAEEGFGPAEIDRVTKALAPVRFVAFGPAENLFERLRSPAVTAYRLGYDESDAEEPPPPDPAKQYIGDGEVLAARAIESAEVVDKLQKLFADRETYNNPEGVECDSPDFAIRFTDKIAMVEVRLCLECHYALVSERPHSAGLIAEPGRRVRYDFAVNSEAAKELGTILAKLFVPVAEE